MIEVWFRVSPFLAWGDFHARSRFARSTIPEDNWGTTRSLGFIAYSKISTLDSGLRKLWFRMPDSPDTCARKQNPQRKRCGFKKIRVRVDGAFKLATATAMATLWLTLFDLPQNTNNDKTRQLHKSKWKWRGSPKRNHEAYRHWAPSE